MYQCPNCKRFLQDPTTPHSCLPPAPIDLTKGMDPITTVLFNAMRPDLLISLQERVTKQTEELSNNIKGLLQISSSLSDLNLTLKEISKMNDTIREVRNTLVETNKNIKELSEKL